ncbi:MAG: choice-of-anchor J domain-containing protein [Acidobacteria bacterium]|nr:choice-of-anchor J domain-containing protein [Acidobacteriota bacterium]
MRSAIALTFVWVLAAVPAAAQSFSQEFDDITTLPAAGWAWDNNSTAVGTASWAPLTANLLLRGSGEFQGNTTVFPQNTGTGYIGDNYNATTGASTISDWLMTPAVTMMNGDTLSFYTRCPDPSDYPDRLQVRLSLNSASTNVGTLPEDVGDFTTLLLDINPTLAAGGYPNTWTQYTITVSGLPGLQTGRFAFRYYVTNGGPSGANSNYIGLDTLVFTSASPVELQNLQVE